MKLQDFEGMEGLENIRGYIALFDAIMKEKSANKALKTLDATPSNDLVRHNTKDEVENLINFDYETKFSSKEERAAYMVKLKKMGMSYRNIGKLFDLSQRTIFLRIREYMKERGIWEDRSWKLSKGGD